MRIVLRAPDNSTRDQMARALSIDETIEVVDEPAGPDDLLLIHAGLFQANGRDLQAMMRNMRAVIVSAPSDPELLAGFMSAGARGYHRIDEPAGCLVDVVRLVERGGARADPEVMEHVLRVYRRLLRNSIRYPS